MASTLHQGAARRRDRSAGQPGVPAEGGGGSECGCVNFARVGNLSDKLRGGSGDRWDGERIKRRETGRPAARVEDHMHGAVPVCTCAAGRERSKGKGETRRETAGRS